jgi:DNA-binding response OmpR family regulator
MARILIIEDERMLREMIADELTDFGHEVRQAADGEEGLRSAREMRPDVILSDITMPKVNGFKLKQALDGAGIKTTFIFVSGRDSKDAVADGLMMGAAHYFTKPIDFDRLNTVIQGAPVAA